MTQEKDNVRSPTAIDCQNWLSLNIMCKYNIFDNNQLIFSIMCTIFTNFDLMDTYMF